MLTNSSFSSVKKPKLSRWEKFKLQYGFGVHYAALRCDWPTVKKCIIYHQELNINLDTVPEDYDYPLLHSAIIFQQNEIISLLLENNARTDTFSKDSPPSTPLEMALASGAITTIKLLILNGANYKNVNTNLDDSESAMKNSIYAVEDALKQKLLAETYLTKFDFNNAYCAYIKAGDNIFYLLKNETNSYVIRHIIKQAAPYYEEAIKLYSSLSPKQQTNYKSDVNKIKTVLKKIGIIFSNVSEFKIAEQAEPSTPTSDNDTPSFKDQLTQQRQPLLNYQMNNKDNMHSLFGKKEQFTSTLKQTQSSLSRLSFESKKTQ